MKLTMLPDKKIRTKSKEVTFPLTDEVIQIIEGMIKHIDDSQKPNSEDRAGVGIAAVQVGHLYRMYYISARESNGEEEWKEFLINPKIIKMSETKAALEQGEGCLSVGDEIPNQEGLVHRRWEVTVEGYSFFQKKNIRITKTGYQAIIIQHEQDHLNAMLFIDRIDPINKWNKKENEILI